MISTRQEETATVLTVTVSEIQMYVIPEFKSALLGQLQNKPALMVLEMDQVEFIDSSGIGALLLMSKKAKETGTRLFMINLRPEIRDALEVTGALGLLSIRETLAEVFEPD